MSTACVQQGLYFQFLPIFRSKKDPGEIPLRVLLVLHQLFFNFFFCFRFRFDFRLFMNRSFYQRKADSLAGFIYADDTDSQIIANPADIARFLVMILCHLIDVEQAGKPVFQFYNNAEFKDFYHSCTDYIIHFMVFDSSFPWIRKAVFVAERNSLFSLSKDLILTSITCSGWRTSSTLEIFLQDTSEI